MRPGVAVSSLSAGGGKRGAAANTWATLAADTDSDSDTDCSSAAATLAAFRAAFAATTPVKKAAVPCAAPGAPARPRRTPMTDSDPVVGPPRTVLARQMAEAGERHFSLLEGDPILEALHRGDSLWGDILCDGATATYDGAPLVFATLPITPPPAYRRRARTEDDLWSQPWAARLDEYFADHYDTRALTDAEWEAMLTWLYAEGWEVCDYDRDGVKAYPDDMPPRIWVRPPPEDDALPARGLHGKFRGIAEADDHHHDCACDHHHTHAAPAPTKTLESRKATIPRFCRAGAECADMDCRFVHADTIPRINEPCKFGADCGASDPTGLKRSQCLRMHPGETWTEEMVIVRPPAAAAAAGAGKEETTA